MTPFSHSTAAALGRRGGAVVSRRKSTAARRNGRKGGRPNWWRSHYSWLVGRSLRMAVAATGEAAWWHVRMLRSERHELHRDGDLDVRAYVDGWLS